MENIPEIKQVISDKQSDNDALYTRFESDFDLLIGTPYEADDAGEESYTSTAPQNFFSKIIDGLLRAQMSIQIKLPDKSRKKMREAASEGEMYLFAALNAIDRRRQKRGDKPLRETLSFWMCCRGQWALRALVFVPNNETETVFDV